MKSIIQSERTCYLCMMLYGSSNDILEEHHIFGGTSNRKNSEKYGLKVWLCPSHHRTGDHAVHRNKETMDKLHEVGQKAFEQKHTRQEFMKIFGKSYI